METEINSQPEIIENLAKKYITNYCFSANVPSEAKRLIIVASGSSYNAGLFGKYFFENIANIECCVEYASEYSALAFNNFDKEALYIFISQSGNSIDTVKAMDRVIGYGCKTLCVTNNTNSEIYNKADYKFDIEAGEEFAIAATKSFSATVFMLWILACKVAQNRHIPFADEMKNITSIGTFLRNSLDGIENLDVAAKYLSKQKDISFCAFGKNFPLSLEAALKIKETSYINTCAYPLGEFIHGHFAILNKSKTLVVFINEDCSKTELELLEKITKTYKTKLVVISDSWSDLNSEILIKIPKNESKICTIINMIVALQLLSLKIAIRLRRNIDKPKGLVKIVK